MLLFFPINDDKALLLSIHRENAIITDTINHQTREEKSHISKKRKN